MPVILKVSEREVDGVSSLMLCSKVHCIVVGAPGIFLDLLRSVRMLKREWVRKATESYRTYSVPGKTAALDPEFAVEDLPSAELQPALAVKDLGRTH